VSDVGERAAGAGDDARLAAAVKRNDGFFATFFVSPYSPHLVRWAARRGIRPNLVTTGSLLVGVGAAALFGTGARAGLIAGAVALQASFTLDCVDGQLARYTGRLSAFGGWYDGICDRVKEWAVYAGLAIGSVRGFGHPVWGLAGTALCLQAARQLLDLSFGARRAASPDPATAPARAPSQGPGSRIGAGVADLSRSSDSRAWLLWARRIVILPIGERWLLISVTAAASRPVVTFVALLAWGGLAAAYALAGRFLRSLALPAGVVVPSRLRDDGPLDALVGNLPRRVPPAVATVTALAGWLAGLAAAAAGVGDWRIDAGAGLAWLVGWGTAGGARPAADRFDWTVWPLLHLAEYAGVVLLAAAAAPAALGPAFGFAAVVAMHHYDLVYRDGGVSQRVAGVLAGGWAVRLTLAFALAAAGVARPAFAVVAAALAVLFVAEAALDWARPHYGDRATVAPAEELL
jgi:hypothetical protein